jgi:hypothetical protein
MRLEVGDMVRYARDPQRLGVVVMTRTTITGADVCEVIVLLDSDYPEAIGKKRYSNQDYWKKAEIDSHKTYGES